MSRGMGVVLYSTPEGGSGYIANSALPWLSWYNITQQAPVYDQNTAWLRDTAPGSYTNYSRFGPPYSMDGGVLPPYTDGAPQPVPYQGCGMGAVDSGVLLRSDVVAPMPSITGAAWAGCDQPVDTCPSGIASWVDSNPWLVALALAAGYVLFGGKKK